MRGNAWQVTAIIAIILVVVLIVPLVIMGRNHQTLSDQARQARSSQDESARRAAAAEGELQTLQALIGAPGAALEESEIMDKALPGENPATRTYHGALVALLGDLEREREEHRRTSEEKSQLQSDFDNAKDSYDERLRTERENVLRAEAARDAERRQFAVAKQEYDRQLKDAQDQQGIALARLERQGFELNDHIKQLEHANHDIRDTNINLAGMLEDIRNPNVDHPAGKIITVDQRAGTAVIDLGSADGLLIRTMFSVYHSSITGLSFRTVSVERDPVYCDVCRRDIGRDVSKASIEVTRILGPHRAEVRILDDILTDPIMAGDVIYSPIWRPGQQRRFALTAGMHLPGSSLDSGTEAIKLLIEMNGGIVDCWIDENVPEGEDVLKGSLSDLTHFIVVNERDMRILDPEVARVQQALMESAKNRVVKTISLTDLLSRMGWRNVTPVYTFGSGEFTPEMRVVPQTQGTSSRSSGVVSPIFTPGNLDARVNARDANPVRDSSGIVSPLFNDNAPPAPASSGRTSELFRPRSPGVGGN